MNIKRSTNYCLFIAFSAVSLLLSGFLTLAFLFRKTWFFTALFHISDPSTSPFPEAMCIGLLISTILFVAILYSLLVIFIDGVYRNALVYEKVKDLWNNLTPGLISRSMTPDEALGKLSGVVLPGTHLGAAVHSWQGASPSSDPEYVIQGVATGNRSRLTSLQVIANILILIGLMGNFFGLNHAVRELPVFFGNARPIAEKKAPHAIKINAHKLDYGITRGDSVTDDAPPPQQCTQGLDGMQHNVQSISQGLSVVVVSSLLGILGMIWLLGYTSWLKGMFNTLVVEEITLASAEIAPVLLPKPEEELKRELLVVVKSMADVPVHLEEFKSSTLKFTEALQKSNFGLTVIGDRMERVISGELDQAAKAYRAFQESMGNFATVLHDEHHQVMELAGTSKNLVHYIEALTKEVEKLTDGARATFSAHHGVQSSHREYIDNGLKAMEGLKGIMVASWEALDRRQEIAHKESLNVVEAQLRDLCAALREENKQIFREQHKVLEEHRNMAEAVLGEAFSKRCELVFGNSVTSLQALASEQKEIQVRSERTLNTVLPGISEGMRDYLDFLRASLAELQGLCEAIKGSLRTEEHQLSRVSGEILRKLVLSNPERTSEEGNGP